MSGFDAEHWLARVEEAVSQLRATGGLPPDPDLVIVVHRDTVRSVAAHMRATGQVPYETFTPLSIHGLEIWERPEIRFGCCSIMPREDAIRTFGGRA